MTRRIVSAVCLLLFVASFAHAARKTDGLALNAPLGSAPSLEGADVIPESIPVPPRNSVLKTPAVAPTKRVIGQEQVIAKPLPVICSDKRCIDYKSHRLGSKCKFSKCATHEVCVLFKDDCDCCYVQVPVCVPDCCTEICSIDCRRGAFGRDITEYRWDCGFRMAIVADRCGDLTVHYYGMVR